MNAKQFALQMLAMKQANLRCAMRTMIVLHASGKELEEVKRMVKRVERERKELER